MEKLLIQIDYKDGSFYINNGTEKIASTIGELVQVVSVNCALPPSRFDKGTLIGRLLDVTPAATKEMGMDNLRGLIHIVSLANDFYQRMGEMVDIIKKEKKVYDRLLERYILPEDKK